MPVKAWPDPVLPADFRHGSNIESTTLSAACAATVEDFGNFTFGVFFKQRINFGDDRSWRSIFLTGRKFTRDTPRLHGTPTQTSAQRDGRVIMTGKCDIINQQVHHALVYSLRCLRIVPQVRKVGRKTHDFLPLPLIESVTVIALALIVMLCVAVRSQRLVPLRLKHISHQPVIRMRLYEALLGNSLLFGGALNLLRTQTC